MKAKKTFGMAAFASFLVFTAAISAAPWKFGLISDTQWPAGSDDGKNPNSVAVDIINQVNKEFVSQGVKLVIAIGDMTDAGTTIALDTRATYAQALYNAGIAFYPLRGNHESTSSAATEFVRIFPQTQSGINNNTPSNAFVYTDSANTHPVAKTGSTFTVGGNFSSPSTSLAGLSYAFTYNNATFVLLDQFTPANGSSNTIDNQQSWISGVLSGKPAMTHAFVLAHKGIITQNHADVLFGSTPAVDSAGTNAFIRSLAKNGVRYYIGGHDHHHNWSLVKTTRGDTSIQELVLASDSYKFYTPVKPPPDSTYDFPAFGRTREIPISQELNNIGYYIVTVDSLRVTVDYYAVAANPDDSGDIATTPPLTGNWKRHETFGYGLNGRNFLIAQGQSYATVVDSFSGTVGRILGGVNTVTSKDYASRSFSQLVTTGWSTATLSGLSRNVLTLWGMALNLSSDQAAVFSLSLGLGSSFPSADLMQGKVGILSRDSSGAWINSVALNYGGTPQFVPGVWSATYPLGTWGIDTVAHTAWAVVNHAGDFSVAPLAQTSIVTPPAFRPSSRAGAMLLRGTTLILPAGFAGDGAMIELADCSGRVIERIVSKGDSIDLSKFKSAAANKVVLFTATSGRDRISQTMFLP